MSGCEECVQHVPNRTRGCSKRRRRLRWVARSHISCGGRLDPTAKHTPFRRIIQRLVDLREEGTSRGHLELRKKGGKFGGEAMAAATAQPGQDLPPSFRTVLMSKRTK